MDSKRAIQFIVLCTIFTSIGQLFLKKGAVEFVSVFSFSVWPLVVGLATYGIGMGFMLLAFQRGELSVLYPFLASSYIWVSLLSPLFFNDSMNIVKWIGITVVLLAVISFGIGSSKEVEA